MWQYATSLKSEITMSIHLLIFILVSSIDLSFGFRQFRNQNGDKTSYLRRKRDVQYNYDKLSQYGPQHWAEYWKDCRGSRQSPVNLKTEKAKFSLFWINLDGITQAFKGKFVNNGHAPTFQLLDNGSTMSGLPYFKHDVFRLAQFHFHFGHTRNTGTEHSVDGKRYAVEVHLVHYNIKYGTLAKAINKVDGLAVLAVLMEERDHRPTPFDDFMQRLGNSLINPEGKGASCSFNPFEIVPEARTFLYYRGSLTTPGCYQSVNWVVFKNHLYIRPQTLEIFRKMETPYHHEHISDKGNLRPLQPLNHRRVLRNFILNI